MKFQDLLAYQKSFALAMEIFEISKTFPVEEKYLLTDQIRRSSRSVSANIAESTRKRRYLKHFISNLPIATVKMPKHKYGWNMRAPVNIQI